MVGGHIRFVKTPTGGRDCENINQGKLLQKHLPEAKFSFTSY
jgi:hypothetical protein